jgi:hypothetical protein
MPEQLHLINGEIMQTFVSYCNLDPIIKKYTMQTAELSFLNAVENKNHI